MRNGSRIALVLVTLAIATASALEPVHAAQEPQTGQTVLQLVPLEVEIVISRYLGEKRVSRTPYALAVNANSDAQRAERAQLNIGAEVPVPMTTFTPAGNNDSGAKPLVSFNYRSVGTAIECWATVLSDGRYALNLSIEESSVYSEDSGGAQSTVAGSPVFRSYESRNTLLLRNGQSRPYIAATDRVSGEVIRIEATVRVVD